jgi:hypothetical protein
MSQHRRGGDDQDHEIQTHDHEGASAELLHLGREIRETDPHLHDQMMGIVREIARTLRDRMGTKRAASAALFGPRRAKPSA